MGASFGSLSMLKPSTSKNDEKSEKMPVENFEFHDPFIEETNNGLYLNGIYLPEEVVMMILSYVEPKEILTSTLVCKKWCNLIKSEVLWSSVYSRRYNKKPKRLPWYVYYCFFTTNYFDQNLIKNGNGQCKYKHWKIISNFGDGFAIENPPAGADPLPLDVPEFNGKTSCFATSYDECNKLQEISLENSNLMQLILNKYKPHIYLSEWVAGRFDCGCVYTLTCKLYGKREKENKAKNSLQNVSRPRSRQRNLRALNAHHHIISLFDESSEDDNHEKPLYVQQTGTRVEQWQGSAWSKVELVNKDYPDGVKNIVFQHQGIDTQFWKGHYGSKMAGGLLKILFDTIEPCI